MKLVLLLCAALRTRGAGFGVDWGAEFHKSSMLIPGQNFRAVENELSKRKTQNLLSLCGQERHFDAQAAAKLARESCQGFYLTNRLFEAGGLEAAQRMLVEEDRHVAASNLLGDAHGLAFALNSPEFLEGLNLTRTPIANNTHYLRHEEVVAMLMEKNLQNAQATGKTSFGFGVMTLWSSAVPIRVRRALHSAWALAGLRLTGFVHENLAAGVYDSLGRAAEPRQERHLFFVNIGSSGTRASIVTYSSAPELRADNSTHWLPAVSAAEHLFFPDFSGHALDRCLADAALVAAGRQGQSLPLAKTRQLYREVKRAKELLSASKETQLVIEDFFETSPLSVKLSRALFEKSCAGHFALLKAQLAKLRKRADALKLKVERAELMGGTVRVPRVQEVLKEALQVPLATRINGDEGMSLGAAIVAANLTAGVRLPKILLEDRPAYGIALELRAAGAAQPFKSKTLFEAGAARLGQRRVIAVESVEEDFEVLLRETPGDYQASFSVRGTAQARAGLAEKNITESKLHLSFELDQLGLPRLRRAEALFKELRALNATSLNVTHRQELPFNRTGELPPALEDAPQLFEESRRLLREVSAREGRKRLLAERRNRLESLAYNLRELAEEGSPFLAEAEARAMGETAAQLGDYLESDGFWRAGLEELERKLAEAEGGLRPLTHRKAEHEARERARPEFEAFFANFTAEVEALRTTHTWLNATSIDALLQRFNDTRADLEAQFRAQAELPQHSDPLFTVSQAQQRVQGLRGELRRLRLTPKPRPAAPEPLPPGFEDLLKNMNMTQEQMDSFVRSFRSNATLNESEVDWSAGQNSTLNASAAEARNATLDAEL